MKHYAIHVGIDVAKSKHDCCVMDNEAHILIKKFSFDNTLPGYQKLVDTVTTLTEDHSSIIFGMEMTGIYGHNLFERLKANGFNVIMIKPETVMRYRDYKGLPKSDKLDARCITEILVRNEAVAIPSQKKEYGELKLLTRRRSALSKMLTQEKNRFLARIDVYFPDLPNVFKSGHTTLKAVFSSYSTPYSITHADKAELLALIKRASKNRYGVDKMNELILAAHNSIAVHTSISPEDYIYILSLLESINFLEKQISDLDKMIEAKAIQFDAYSVLLSFTGCGKTTAAVIIGELGDLSRFHKASQIVSFAGLYGNNSQSGSSIDKRGKISKKGSRELRHALYLVAEFARRNNPVLKDYFTRKKNGDKKKHILAVNAVANKLCAILFSIIRNHQTYVIKHRDLLRLPEVTRTEFFQNADTVFSPRTRRKIYLFEDEFGAVNQFVFKSTNDLAIE